MSSIACYRAKAVPAGNTCTGKQWIERRLELYRQLDILNVFHNENSRDFGTGLTSVFTLACIMFIYASLRAYNTVNIYVYLVLLLAGTFDMLMLTVMYPCLSIWELRSRDLLGLFHYQVTTATNVEKEWRKWALRKLRALKPIQQQLSRVNPVTLAVTRECVEQVFNAAQTMLKKYKILCYNSCIFNF